MYLVLKFLDLLLSEILPSSVVWILKLLEKIPGSTIWTSNIIIHCHNVSILRNSFNMTNIRFTDTASVAIDLSSQYHIIQVPEVPSLWCFQSVFLNLFKISAYEIFHLILVQRQTLFLQPKGSFFFLFSWGRGQKEERWACYLPSSVYFLMEKVAEGIHTKRWPGYHIEGSS